VVERGDVKASRCIGSVPWPIQRVYKMGELVVGDVVESNGMKIRPMSYVMGSRIGPSIWMTG
jgi:hypothetical protein